MRIGTILIKLAKEEKPFVAAVFLLIGLLAGEFVGSLAYPVRGGSGVWGGPALVVGKREGVLRTFLFSQPRMGVAGIGHLSAWEGMAAVSRTFLAAALDDFGITPGFAPRSEFASYKVARGDTPSSLAVKFGVSLDTILGANPDLKVRSMKIGTVLQIPPVSGVIYSMRDGDTYESLAERFGVSPREIAGANPSVDMAKMGNGTRLIIPGSSVKIADSGRPLPMLKGVFMMPAAGLARGILHPVNAVDIAGVCGSPVVAAAEGLVVPDERYSEGREGWNGGYGTFVLVEHPVGSNVRTRSAHLKTVSVEVGDYVHQGQQIGVMGDTGDATGCHLHFEVLGAVNPFAK